MHVEFRLCDVAQVCAFDPESYYRMKELMTRIRASSNDGTDGEGKASLQGSEKRRPLLQLDRLNSNTTRLDKKDFCPQLKLQLVCERLVKLEGTELLAKADRIQHEKLLSTNWDGSEIKTRRYSVSPREIILTAFPSTVVDCVIKLRLLQLPPLLSAAAQRKVQAAIGGTYEQDCKYNTPLCIGVAKITLRELFTARGGVCIALQPKQSVVRAVEELNLNTVATNAMFGKDVGGSAFLTFEVISYSFGRVSTSKLLMFRSEGRWQCRETERPGSVSCQNPMWDLGSSPEPCFEGASSSLESKREASCNACIGVGPFDSAAVRFVLIPYMVLVDEVLRLHEIFSWRNPLKTAILLLITLLGIEADLLKAGIFLCVIFKALVTVRNVRLLYRIPVALTGRGPLASPLMSGSQVFLYGRHNEFINALVRARVFFSQGLQEECYFEVVLIFHLVRLQHNRIILLFSLIFFSVCFLSVESFVVLGLLSCLLIYPVAVRLPNPWSTRRSRQQRTSLTLQSIIKSFQLYAPMRVVRVYQVSLMPPQMSRGPVSKSYSKETSIDGGVLPSPNTVVANSGPSDTRLPTYHRRARTFDGLGTVAAAERKHLHNKSLLPFAVVSFKYDQTVSTNNENELFVARLQRHFENARLFRENTGVKTRGTPANGGTPSGFDGSQGSYTFPSDHAEMFFRDTLGLLHHIRRYATFRTYISVSGRCGPTTSSDTIPLSVVARPGWLLQAGADDGITATLTAMSHPCLPIRKFAASSTGEREAKAMALVAAYFIQAARLSIYCPGEGNNYCSVIFPMEAEGMRLKRYPSPNPCPQTLFQALTEIWRGDISPKNNITMSSDIVLQMVGALNVTGGVTTVDLCKSPEEDSPFRQISTFYRFDSPSARNSPLFTTAFRMPTSYGALSMPQERSASSNMRKQNAMPLRTQTSGRRSVPQAAKESSDPYLSQTNNGCRNTGEDAFSS